jgi:hypothetical protein
MLPLGGFISAMQNDAIGALLPPTTREETVLLRPLSGA